MMNEFNPDGKDIRFIDSHYRDLFRIPDGGTIQVHYSDDSVVIKPCKFMQKFFRCPEFEQYRQPYTSFFQGFLSSCRSMFET